jgi:hypothetical protein
LEFTVVIQQLTLFSLYFSLPAFCCLLLLLPRSCALLFTMLLAIPKFVIKSLFRLPSPSPHAFFSFILQAGTKLVIDRSEDHLSTRIIV